MDVAKVLADQVYLSSILPRADDKADMIKIDTINQPLTTTANNLDVDFINHDSNFGYWDDTIDESLLYPSDKLHLSFEGVTRLILNLNLQQMAGSCQH